MSIEKESLFTIKNCLRKKVDWQKKSIGEDRQLAKTQKFEDVDPITLTPYTKEEYQSGQSLFFIKKNKESQFMKNCSSNTFVYAKDVDRGLQVWNWSRAGYSRLYLCTPGTL